MGSSLLVCSGTDYDCSHERIYEMNKPVLPKWMDRQVRKAIKAELKKPMHRRYPFAMTNEELRELRSSLITRSGVE
jgi:hypothetical protein